MHLPSTYRPLLGRSSAIALLGAGLCLLAFPQSCEAAPGLGECDAVASVELRDGAGATRTLWHLRCAGEDRVDLCDGERCSPDRCAPAGVTVDDLGTLSADGWLEPPIALPRPDGSQEALLIRRLGNGGYPLVMRYALEEGGVRCEDLEALEPALESAEAQLGPEESFGPRGGRIEVIEGQLVITKGIYRPEDPNCCPSQGVARLWLRLDRDGRSFGLARIERRGPFARALQVIATNDKS